MIITAYTIPHSLQNQPQGYPLRVDQDQSLHIQIANCISQKLVKSCAEAHDFPFNH